jgi:multiple sugar transport system substrate-binding protein
MRASPSFSTVRTKRYGIAIYTDNSYDALVMGYENALFSYGGDLGDYATFKVDGVVNSAEAVAALEMYRELYGFTPPNWGKVFFQEDNQAITEGLAAMSMNYFAFFPALANEATNPNAKVTGYFANPAGPRKQHAALGGRAFDITYFQKQAESSSSQWFIRETSRRRGDSAATRNAVLESENSETPRRLRAFYQSMHREGFRAVRCRASFQINNRIYPSRREGSAKEA